MTQKPYHENELPIILSPKLVAEVLGISLPFSYDLFRSDGFPAFKINTRWVVLRDALFLCSQPPLSEGVIQQRKNGSFWLPKIKIEKPK